MNKETIDSLFMPDISITGLKHNNYDTLYICAKRTVIKDKELCIEIDLKGRVNQFNKIVIDGITFVKKSNHE